jgi:hypothetical protein
MPPFCQASSLLSGEVMRLPIFLLLTSLVLGTPAFAQGAAQTQELERNIWHGHFALGKLAEARAKHRQNSRDAHKRVLLKQASIDELNSRSTNWIPIIANRRVRQMEGILASQRRDVNESLEEGREAIQVDQDMKRLQSALDRLERQLQEKDPRLAQTRIDRIKREVFLELYPITEFPPANASRVGSAQ